MHKVVDGPIDKSYGIHVAKLAKMPDELLKRASKILKVYEAHDTINNKIEEQVSFNFDESINNNNELIEYIDSIDINKLRPIDAINVLDEIKKLNNK